MGQSSQGGRVIFRTQTAQGTYPTDMATAGICMKLRGGSLDPSRDLLIPDAEIGGGRDISDAFLGAVVWSGEYSFYARMDALPTLLKAALGTGAVDDTGNPAYSATITPSDAAGLPFLAIEERIGASLEVFQYTDCVVNTLHLEADANGYLSGTVGVIAAKQTAGNTAVSEDDLIFDNSSLIVGTNVIAKYNSVDLKAKSFKLDINNNFESDDFRLGSFYVGALTPKRREITAGVTVRPEDSSMWRSAVYGGSSLTAPGGTTNKQPILITAETYDFITGTTPRSLSITIPKAAPKPYGFGANGDDVIQNDIEFEALRPDPGTAILTAVVVNGQEAIA